MWYGNPGCLEMCCDDGCGTITVFVRTCFDDSPVAGATVTVKDPEGVEVGTATADGAGLATIAIPAAATYTIVVEADGWPTSTSTFAATCTANHATVEFGRSYFVAVQGCNGRPMPGATVALALDGVTYSAVTDAAGNAEITTSVDGTFAVTVTAPLPGFAVAEAEIEMLGCGGYGPDTFFLEPDAGHKCVTWGDRLSGAMLQNGQCLYPWPTTLYLTDALYGPTTLTWYAVSPWGGFSDAWYGTKAVAVPACGECPASGTTLHYFLSRTAAISPVSGTLSPLSVRSYADPAANNCPGPADDGGGRVNGHDFDDDAQVSCPPSPVASFTLLGGTASRSPYCDDTAVTITA